MFIIRGLSQYRKLITYGFRDKYMIVQLRCVFSSDKQNSNQVNKQQSGKESLKKQSNSNSKNILQYIQENNNQIEQKNEQHSQILRNFKQTQVPGLQSRKYSDLNEDQQQIIKTNKFDLQKSNIIPKTFSSNSFAGINDNLTQISLGQIKIKQENQVFLSQVDPYNIPADLDIKFDSKKNLKLVGKQTNRTRKIEQNNESKQPNNHQIQMKIQPQTIQHKSIYQNMQKQFGVGIKGYKYSNIKSIRRWDLFLSLLMIVLFLPILNTYNELSQFYKSSKDIEDQRMRQIVQLKQKSFRKILFQNQDFNKIN